jgi:hypothetical protein
MRPRQGDGPIVPLRGQFRLAPWLVIGVVLWGYSTDHHVHSAQDLVVAVARDLSAGAERHGGLRPGAAPTRTSTGRLSARAISFYARGAGFTHGRAVTATAIALAESRGHVRAHNPVPPDDSYCLMQINMLGDLGPARRARFHLRSNTDLYDPATCMRAAYALSNGGADWSPWTTYTRGTYLRYLPLARAQEGR